MAKKKNNEVKDEVLAMPAEEVIASPINDDFHVVKRENTVAAVNVILSNVQTLIHYLEFALSKGVFSFGDCADIYASINEINNVTDNMD